MKLCTSRRPISKDEQALQEEKSTIHWTPLDLASFQPFHRRRKKHVTKPLVAYPQRITFKQASFKCCFYSTCGNEHVDNWPCCKVCFYANQLPCIGGRAFCKNRRALDLEHTTETTPVWYRYCFECMQERGDLEDTNPEINHWLYFTEQKMPDLPQPQKFRSRPF